MVDFNRFGTHGTPNELRLRAERLRTEVQVNCFWYDLVTLAIPRFASREDAERVSNFINRRMTRSRRMELELRWLDSLLEEPPAEQPAGTAAAFTALREVVPPLPSSTFHARRHAWLFAFCVALLSARDAIGGSGPGALVLILAVIGACGSGVHLLGATLLWIAECIEGRRDMQAVRTMTEPELLRWFRANRVVQIRDAAERARAGAGRS